MQRYGRRHHKDRGETSNSTNITPLVPLACNASMLYWFGDDRIISSHFQYPRDGKSPGRHFWYLTLLSGRQGEFHGPMVMLMIAMH